MSKVDESLEAQIRNIETRYGKSLAEWFTIIRHSGETKHPQIVAMLKRDYGMTHGSAHRVALKAREASGESRENASKNAITNQVDTLYSGKKAGLKPIHDALIRAIC